MNKKIIIPILIAGVIILVAGAAVGGFFYGKSYESNRASTIRNDFMRERGIQGFDPNSASTGGMPDQNANPNAQGTTGNFPGGSMGMGRGASGEIKSIEGNTLTLTSGDTETVMNLSDATTIVKYTTGSTADLVAGQQVMVTGERDADGKITTVTQVTILDASVGQPPAGTTP
jgi:hypothetical protein